eukprot:RCo001072
MCEAMARRPSVRDISMDPHLQYIQSEKLYVHVDLLVSRFLEKRPSSAGSYFERFMQFLDDQESSLGASGSRLSPPKRSVPRLATGSVRPDTSSTFLASPTSANFNSSVLSIPYFKTQGSSDATVQGGFKLLYEIPEQDCMEKIFEALRNGELTAECFGSLEEGKDPEAHKFRNFKIKVNDRKFDLRGAGAPPKCHAVPCELRLGHLFLWQLGIDHHQPDLIPPNTDKVASLPCVRFRSQLQRQQTPNVIISASSLEEYLKERFSLGKLENWRGSMAVDDLSEVFGKEEFHVDMGELKMLADLTRVLTAVLPEKFFLKMVSIVSRDDAVKWYYEHKEVALSEMGEGTDLCELGKLIQKLTASPELRVEFGFPQTTYWTNVTRQSLSELSTQVCVACMGYLFTGYNNQIAPRTKFPILFLSASAINFSFGLTSAQERQKYFSSETWTFIEGGKEQLKDRIKQMWRVLFEACRRYKVKYPTAVPIGLSNFLKGFQGRCAVMQVYHEAMFEVLSTLESLRGAFNTFYLYRSGASQFITERILLRNNYDFPCRVVVHQRDPKALAWMLAAQGKQVAYIHSSDPVAAIQGCAGNRWASGKDNEYSWCEDLVANSTAIIARSNICALWGNPEENEKEAAPCSSGSSTQLA